MFCLICCSVIVGYAFITGIEFLLRHPILPHSFPSFRRHQPPLFLRLVQSWCLFSSFYRFFFIRVAYHFRTLVFRRRGLSIVFCSLFRLWFVNGIKFYSQSNKHTYIYYTIHQYTIHITICIVVKSKRYIRANFVSVFVSISPPMRWLL